MSQRSTLSTLSTLTLILACSACSDWQVLTGAPDDLSEIVEDGTYVGDVDLEIRVFAGPIRVRQITCSEPLDVVVDKASDVSVVGELMCSIEGQPATIALAGTLNDDLSVTGALDVQGMELPWSGWFYDPTGMYAEGAGQVNEQGLRVEYAMYYDGAL